MSVMESTDQGTFDRAFRRVCGAFRVRLSSTELSELSGTYFRVLEPYPLDRVLAVAKGFLGTRSRLPFPAEWLSECAPVRAIVDTAPDTRQLAASEIDAHEAALLSKCEGAPCACAVCVCAGVDHLALRYVPDEDYSRAWNPRRNVLQLTGHWAHGEELRRWYEARAALFAQAHRHGVRLSQVLVRDDEGGAELVTMGREPGEEG